MKIAIVGAAYTGLATARHFRRQGHTVAVTTTRADRAAELAPVADRVVVTKGSDPAGMRELIRDADVVVLTMAGGLGVNLQTADTVVLFDSDWNPQVRGLVGWSAGCACPCWDHPSVLTWPPTNHNSRDHQNRRTRRPWRACTASGRPRWVKE